MAKSADHLNKDDLVYLIDQSPLRRGCSYCGADPRQKCIIAENSNGSFRYAVDFHKDRIAVRKDKGRIIAVVSRRTNPYYISAPDDWSTCFVMVDWGKARTLDRTSEEPSNLERLTVLDQIVEALDGDEQVLPKSAVHTEIP